MTSLPIARQINAAQASSGFDGARPVNSAPVKVLHRVVDRPGPLHVFLPTSVSAALPILLLGTLAGLAAELLFTLLAAHRPVQMSSWPPQLWIQGGLLAGILALAAQLRSLTLRHAHLSNLAHSDELTGLPNRRALIHQLQQQISRPVPQGPSSQRPVGMPSGRPGSQRAGQQTWSLLLIDLDHFKAVNDEHGHQAGDEVLKAVTACLRADLRRSDVLGRWGGEEFLVLLPGASFEGAMVAAQRLRQCVARQTFSASRQVTVSIGVATCRPGDSLERVVARADAGMYRAKRAGRNRVGFSD